MNKIPFSKVDTDTVRLYKSLTPMERINLKLQVKRRNYWIIKDNNLILMECVSAFINQNHYVISGDCKRNMDRYEREKH